MGYVYIFATIFFTVYGQIVLKWRINSFDNIPIAVVDKLEFIIIKIFSDFYILSGFLSAFIASIFWIASMTKFELSFAYPFMSSAFIFVFIISVTIFDEAITWQKIIGLIFILIGIFISSRSM